MRMKLFTNDIGEDEVPSSDEGPEFPHSHIGVEVRGARLGNTGSELGVAQTRQHRGQRRDQEAQHDGGTYGRRPDWISDG